MASATVVFNWFEVVAEGANCGSDTFGYAFTASGSAPTTSSTNLASITEVSYTGFSSRTATTSSSSQSSGTFKLILADQVITASANLAAFRYPVLYDDTLAGDIIVQFYDYGSALSVLSGETFTIDNDATNGVFTIA